MWIFFVIVINIVCVMLVEMKRSFNSSKEKTRVTNVDGLVRCSANYTPLTPVSFMKRASMVYGDRVSIIYGSLTYTWTQTYQRCCKLASALNQMKVSHGDIVAALGPNIPELYELHFAVPMAGAIVSSLNIYQDSTSLAAQLKLLEAKVFFVDHQFLNMALDALEIVTKTCTGFKFPQVVLMLETDPEAKTDTYDHRFSGYQTYESLLNLKNDSGFEIVTPKIETDPISVVFTSGTTGDPKGVVHSHRGAYLTTLTEIIINEMKAMPIYLWTVPMFHCNGWCFTWATAALGGTNICIRTYDADFVYDTILKYNVTNLGGATPVLSLIANANRDPLPFKVNIMTGGAPPPPQVVFKIEELGFILTHSYGMSEMLGPGTVFPWRPEYRATLSPQEQANMKALHGLNHVLMEAVDVKDPETMESVPFDGVTLGEVMFRGNTIMKGYYRNPHATEAAFKGGWFHTGDIAVRHRDGNIEVKDRKKDLIVSKGKKISTVDVENVVFSHPAVFEAGVVGRPDEVAGETVCAFVRLKEGRDVNADEIIGFCREKLPEYMVPETVVFGDLPITSTGKTKKAVLRKRARSLL